MTLLRRMLFAAARGFERLRNVILYAAAGTMSVQELREAIGASWDDFNAEDADIHSGLMSWEASFVKRFVEPGDRVLVVGSGTGRDGIALENLGGDRACAA